MTSAQSARALAKYCNSALPGAASLSFVSHSLGARVVLEAVQGLNGKARLIAITTGAVNDDCLTGQYARVPVKTNAAYTFCHGPQNRAIQVTQLLFGRTVDVPTEGPLLRVVTNY